MDTILILRQKLIGIYKLNEDKINILAKFIAGIVVFLCMSSLSLGNFGGTKKIGIIFSGNIVFSALCFLRQNISKCKSFVYSNACVF